MKSGRRMNKPLHNIEYDSVKQEVVDPYSKDNIIFTGYKGNNFMTSGIVYAPYIPMIQTAAHHASTNAYGFVIERPGEDVNRYIYDPDRDGDLNALDDIEKNGLIVLDENEDEHWIDAIHPNLLKDNIERGGPTPLKAKWTQECDEDLQAMYAIKAEKAMTKVIEQSHIFEKQLWEEKTKNS